MANEQELFFTNRELFDRFTEKIDGLTKDLAETQRVVKKYNGLRQKVEEVDDKLDDICKVVETVVAEGAGKNKLASGVSWAIGIIGALIGIAGGILAIASRLK